MLGVLWSDSDSLVLHRDLHFAIGVDGTQVDARVRPGKLRGVVDQVRQHLRQPDRVAMQFDRLRRQIAAQHLVAAGGARRTRLDGTLDERREAELFRPHDDLALHDARNVEQVVDEPRHVVRLAADHVARPVHGRLRHIRALHDVHRVADGRERVAQLVRQHGEELVLAPVRFLHGRVQARVLHGDGRTARDLLDQRDARRVEGFARTHQDQRAARAAARHQRADRRRLSRAAPPDLETLVRQGRGQRIAQAFGHGRLAVGGRRVVFEPLHGAVVVGLRDHHMVRQHRHRLDRVLDVQ